MLPLQYLVFVATEAYFCPRRTKIRLPRLETGRAGGGPVDLRIIIAFIILRVLGQFTSASVSEPGKVDVLSLLGLPIVAYRKRMKK